jgi:hypothetical protein
MYGLPDSIAGYYALKYSRSFRRIRSSRGGSRGVVFSFAVSNVEIYQNALRAELQTPAGGLWKYLEKQGSKAVAAAKRQVGVKTGALRRSIHMKHLANANGQYLWIGSNKNYAYIHHEGTRPHIITPTKAKALRFTSGRRVIYTRMVKHPGTKPNRYLSNQLRFFMMKV